MTIEVRNFNGVLAAETQSIRKARSSQKVRSVYFHTVKRAFDIFLVTFTAPIWLPFIALAALLVATDGHTPFYRQDRIGRGGRIFSLWKLRTMVVDADQRLEAYLNENPQAKAEWDEKQKLAADPRITPIGAFLRKTSLDELPQLINVLLGDMSIVGPRPMMVDQRELYDGEGYYQLRPGLTGLWQVSERNETGFAERSRFDDHYYQTVSFGTDVNIMVRTVGVVVRCTGC